MKTDTSFISAALLGLTLCILPPLHAFGETPGVIGQSCVEDIECGQAAVCLNSKCSAPPQYLLLFTHSEDHINHELSEERYWRFFPEIDALARRHPDAHVSWTVEFMGADAETIAARNPQTRLLDVIRGYAANTRVFQFGYHGAHEPTYTNNAIANLDYSGAAWGDIVFASREFLTLGKHPTLGGVDRTRPGGMKLAQEVFGPARIVSGYGIDQAQIHAADSLAAPYVMFGFADHGAAITGPEYTENVKNFMAVLCPERSTPCGLFWMDGKLRVNDGNPVKGVGLLHVTGSRPELETALSALGEDSVQVMNVHIAPKFLYAIESPTNYAYAHPEAPRLPPDKLLPVEDKEQLYLNSFKNLEFLAGAYLPSKPGSRFVSAPDIQNLFANETGQAVPIDRVAGVARALVDGYDSKPPDFVRVQGRYYTLAESWSLIVQALAAYRANGSLPETVTLLAPHGPINDADAMAAPVVVPALEVLDAAVNLSGNLAPAPWQPYPKDMIPGVMAVGTRTMNAAEYLRAAAFLLVQIRDRLIPVGITIQPASLVTDLHGLLMKIRYPKFPGVCWSLKPARHT